MKVKVIIPALNEAEAVGDVIAAIPNNLVDEVIVVDNGSEDNTAAAAMKAGATVLAQSERGYGNACLKGMAYISRQPARLQPDVVVFLDADGSDYPEEMPELLRPIIENDCDLVIGSRALGKRERGSMTIPQSFGNWLSSKLLRWLYDANFTDLGPFRAVKWECLQELDMQDKTFGWTVEMQAKAAKRGLKCAEVPVNYRCRQAGKSKVSGTVKGTFLAGYKILGVIFRLRKNEKQYYA